MLNKLNGLLALFVELCLYMYLVFYTVEQAR